MKNFQQNLAKLEGADTQVLGVSVDSRFSNKAFADQNGLTFPLLSDWGGKVSKEYGIFMEGAQAARRVNYLIDTSGKVIEMQIDREAIDPNKIVASCERKKLERK